MARQPRRVSTTSCPDRAVVEVVVPNIAYICCSADGAGPSTEPLFILSPLGDGICHFAMNGKSTIVHGGGGGGGFRQHDSESSNLLPATFKP